MKIKIKNTTDHKFEGKEIEYNDFNHIDNLHLEENVQVELIEIIIDKPSIKFISENYIVDGEIIEE